MLPTLVCCMSIRGWTLWCYSSRNWITISGHIDQPLLTKLNCWQFKYTTIITLFNRRYHRSYIVLFLCLYMYRESEGNCKAGRLTVGNYITWHVDIGADKRLTVCNWILKHLFVSEMMIYFLGRLGLEKRINNTFRIGTLFLLNMFFHRSINH